MNKHIKDTWANVNTAFFLLFYTFSNPEITYHNSLKLSSNIHDLQVIIFSQVSMHTHSTTNSDENSNNYRVSQNTLCYALLTLGGSTNRVLHYFLLMSVSWWDCHTRYFHPLCNKHSHCRTMGIPYDFYWIIWCTRVRFIANVTQLIKKTEHRSSSNCFEGL